MHEASLVRNMLDQVRRLAAAEGAEAVDSLELEIGPLSGVVAELVASAFRDLRPEYGWRESTLVIREVPLLAECPDCGNRFELLEFNFRCPRGCQGRVRVVQGEGCILKHVTLRIPGDTANSTFGPSGCSAAEPTEESCPSE